MRFFLNARFLEKLYVLIIGFLMILLQTETLSAGSAREQILGPGSIAILNSTYRPAMTNPINGLTKESRMGVDFGYHVNENTELTSERKDSGFQFIAYGLIPLHSSHKKYRPSGLFIKAISDQQNGTEKSSESSNDLADGSESNNKSSSGLFHFGGVLSISNDWMLSLNLIHKQNSSRKEENSTVFLNSSDEKSQSTYNTSSSYTIPEYGLRIKLSKETSVVVLYNEGYFNKTGQSVEFNKVFLSANTTETYKEPVFSQSKLSMAFKTRVISSVTMAFGLERASEIKTTKASGEPVILADVFSSIGLGFEYRFLFSGKSWLPRIGFVTQTDKTNSFGAGISIQTDAIDIDTGFQQTIKTKEDSKEKKFLALIGIGYRFIDSDQQEDEDEK